VALRLLPFHKGGKGGGGAFNNSIVGNFMFYEDKIEKKLLQLFQKIQNVFL